MGASLRWIGPLPPSATFVLHLGPLALSCVDLSCLFYDMAHRLTPKAGDATASINRYMPTRLGSGHLGRVNREVAKSLSVKS
jgi:hypothetical protein